MGHKEAFELGFTTTDQGQIGVMADVLAKASDGDVFHEHELDTIYAQANSDGDQFGQLALGLAARSEVDAFLAAERADDVVVTTDDTDEPTNVIELEYAWLRLDAAAAKYQRSIGQDAVASLLETI